MPAGRVYGTIFEEGNPFFGDSLTNYPWWDFSLCKLRDAVYSQLASTCVEIGIRDEKEDFVGSNLDMAHLRIPPLKIAPEKLQKGPNRKQKDRSSFATIFFRGKLAI